ncbi:antimicrobial peptide 1-like [Wolffia australiana]
MANSNAAAFVLALLCAAFVVGPASASTLTAFSGPACAGRTKDVNGCGCFSLAGYSGGFHFVFTQGQRAMLYADAGCHGYSELLHRETRRCGHHLFKSIRMIC